MELYEFSVVTLLREMVLQIKITVDKFVICQT